MRSSCLRAWRTCADHANAVSALPVHVEDRGLVSPFHLERALAAAGFVATVRRPNRNDALKIVANVPAERGLVRVFVLGYVAHTLDP